MRITHTITNTKKRWWIRDSDNFKALIFSLSYAKKNYEDVVLYTDISTKKLLKKYKFPYSHINTSLLSDRFGYKTYGAAKFLTLSEQTKPFLHLDHDSVLLQKISDKNKIIVGNPTSKSIISREITDTRMERLEEYIETYETYIDFLLRNPKIIDKEIQDNIDWNYLPSLSIFGSGDFTTISKIVEKLWNIYEFNQPEWDSFHGAGKILDKLLCPAIIKQCGKEGENKIVNMNNNYPLICNDEETFINGKEYSTTELLNNETKFSHLMSEIFDRGWFQPSMCLSEPISRKIMNHFIHEIKKDFAFIRHIENKIPYIFSDRDIFSKSYLIY